MKKNDSEKIRGIYKKAVEKIANVAKKAEELREFEVKNAKEDKQTEEKIVKEFCKIEPRIKYYNTEFPSGSPTKPRNIAIEKAQGRFIAFLLLNLGQIMLIRLRLLNHL